MGLMENIAKLAIRNKVISILRDNCPKDLRNDLETLLRNTPGLDAIQAWVGSCLKGLKGAGDFSVEALTKLDLPEHIRELLEKNRALAEYLVATAKSQIRL